MWRYPELDLLMHGYGDTFTISELQRNTDILACTRVGRAAARHRRADRRAPPDRPLAYALEHQLDWQVLHRSPTIEMLVAPPGW